jgi:hypothetical protein
MGLPLFPSVQGLDRPVDCTDLFAVRRCEHSFTSTINAVVKESNQNHFDTLTNAYENGRRIML